MAVGNMVVDQEVVTRNFPQGRGKMDVIAIYEVEQGQIAKAQFRSAPVCRMRARSSRALLQRHHRLYLYAHLR